MKKYTVFISIETTLLLSGPLVPSFHPLYTEDAFGELTGLSRKTEEQKKQDKQVYPTELLQPGV